MEQMLVYSLQLKVSLFNDVPSRQGSLWIAVGDDVVGGKNRTGNRSFIPDQMQVKQGSK